MYTVWPLTCGTVVTAQVHIMDSFLRKESLLQHRYTVRPLSCRVVVTAQVHSVDSPLRKGSLLQQRYVVLLPIFRDGLVATQ